MMKNTDILKEPSLKEMPFGLPENYFENLKKQTKGIARQDATVIRPKRRLVPYIAAAMLAMLLTAGGFMLGWISGNENFTEEDYIVFSDDMTNIAYDVISDQYADAETMTQDDIIEYLIYTGTEIEDMDEVEQH